MLRTHEISSDSTRVKTNADIKLAEEVVHVALEEPAVGEAETSHPADSPHQGLLLVLDLKQHNKKSKD